MYRGVSPETENCVWLLSLWAWCWESTALVNGDSAMTHAPNRTEHRLSQALSLCLAGWSPVLLGRGILDPLLSYDSCLCSERHASKA